ncbi:MAG: ATP-binding protein [Planctomycetes bacterium]|nr:ATP-binding protein [Planctomycetota bacterium]
MTTDSGSRQFSICGACRAIEETSAALVQLFRELGLSDEKTFALKLAFDEAVTNALEHGHCGDCSQKISIRCKWDEENIILIVADQGPGFCCEDVPNPTIRDNLFKESGRGLYIINSLMSDVKFNEKGNEIRMTLKRTESC